MKKFSIPAVAGQPFSCGKESISTAIMYDGSIYFHAYETATVLGFTNPQMCIREYAPHPVYLSVEREGKHYQGKYIPYSDLLEIGFKSTLQNKEEILCQIGYFHIAKRVEILEKENESLKSLLRETSLALDTSLTQTGKVLELLNSTTEVLNILIAETKR